MKTVTRFAPSPNGNLHLGHAFSAIYAHDLAREHDGEFLLRIEDIDGPRSRREFADNFRRDLEWLGLEWLEVPNQSTRLDSYTQYTQKLMDLDLLYPCDCTRKEIQSLPPRITETGIEYPGSSRGRAHKIKGDFALRLDVDKTMAAAGECVWTDEH